MKLSCISVAFIAFLILFTFFKKNMCKEIKYHVFHWFRTGISIPSNSFCLQEILYHLELECFGTKKASQTELEEIIKVVFMKQNQVYT